MLPKIIHRIVGPNPSPLVLQCVDSWELVKDYGFEIKIWNDDSLETFITDNYPEILPAFTNSRNYAEASDIARYLIVYHFGGYYFDWDIELLDIGKFFELSVENPCGYLVQDPENQTLASEAFSAMAKEQYLFNIVDNIAFIYANNFRHTLPTPQYSGPYRMREVYYFSKKATQQRTITIKSIFLYDYREIRQKPPRERKTAMIHYWEHAWMK